MALVASNHGIKLLAVVSFFVSVWFVFRLGFHHEVPERILGSEQHKFPSSHPPPPPPPPPSHNTHTPPPSSPQQWNPVAVKNADGSHPDVMGEEEAEMYCSNFRMKPFPRDRVKQRKIFDLLLVSTELDMLEIRLGQMGPGVDYFVLMESDKTFTDKAKPLYLQENYDRFTMHHPQMIRRTMDLSSGKFDSTWQREEASRNSMYDQVIPFLEGEQKANLDDVLLVSDVDEMFKPETLKILRNCEIPDRVTAESHLYYYSFQWVVEDSWKHPQATFYKGQNDTILPQDLRMSVDKSTVLRYSGWHCSYCFPTIKEFVQKITSFSHTEFDKDEFKDPDKIAFRVRNGHDLFERSLATRIEANRDAPEFLLANADKYGFMLNRDPKNSNLRDYTPPADLKPEMMKPKETPKAEPQ